MQDICSKRHHRCSSVMNRSLAAKKPSCRYKMSTTSTMRSTVQKPKIAKGILCIDINYEGWIAARKDLLGVLRYEASKHICQHRGNPPNGSQIEYGIIPKQASFSTSRLFVSLALTWATNRAKRLDRLIEKVCEDGNGAITSLRVIWCNTCGTRRCRSSSKAWSARKTFVGTSTDFLVSHDQRIVKVYGHWICSSVKDDLYRYIPCTHNIMHEEGWCLDTSQHS